MADIISVSALNKYVRSKLESDEVLYDIAIRGEISNFTRHSKTGHCYFSLKDTKASVRAVMFFMNASRVAFDIENGMQCVVRGVVSLYERDGTFQINVEFMFRDGVGTAALAFEQLKAKLDAEGLFNAEHKKLIPAWPKKVGIVTSKSGAALGDVLKVAQNRCPIAEFVLAPVQVQGQSAAREVKDAVEALCGHVDVILITRGGGSSEDFNAFNDEELARVVFECKTPVVSAIGHEMDFTILDFVADLRAPTPSAAAEMILPDMKASFTRMLDINTNICGNIHRRMELWYNMLERAENNAAFVRPKKDIAVYENTLNRIKENMYSQLRAGMKNKRQRFAAAAALAESLNPYGVLARGYGIVRKDNTVVVSVQSVCKGQDVDVQLSDGNILCSVQDVRSAGNE